MLTAQLDVRGDETTARTGPTPKLRQGKRNHRARSQLENETTVRRANADNVPYTRYRGCDSPVVRRLGGILGPPRGRVRTPQGAIYKISTGRDKHS